MRKNTRRLLLFGLTSALLLTGCSKKEVVNVDGKQYLKEGDKYIQMNIEKKVFEPGEHIIYYNFSARGKSYDYKEDGWDKVNIGIPEVPEGYKYVDTATIDHGGYGYTSNLVHVFVNIVPVEATSSYSEELGTMGFYEPGVPVQRLTLE